MNYFDLIIIGAGPGGYESAIYAGKRGLQTLLIEKQALGGTCLNRGCIPTKQLLSSVHNFLSAKKLLNSAQTLDFTKTLEANRRLITRMQKGIEKQLSDAKVTVLYGEAVRQRNVVTVNGKEYSGTNIILATGSTPGTIPGLVPDGKKIFTTDDIFGIPQLPASLAIVGAGVIGLEFADIFSGWGVKVTLYDLVDKILPAEDREAIDLIVRRLERRGCIFNLGTKTTAYEGELILVAAGRKPLKIPVDEYCATSEANVYAVGDVNGLSLYAHAATYQGLRVVDNLLGPKKAIDLSNVPRILYTSPQLAAVGRVTENCIRVSLSMLGRAQAEGQTDGFIKMYFNSDRTIAGVVLCAENAESLIGEAVVLVNLHCSLDQLSAMIHPHPSWSEIFSEIGKH